MRLNYIIQEKRRYNMATRVIKQPNGKYAIFSEVVDNFTFIDCSKEECLRALDCNKDRAIIKIDNADRDPNRFDEAMKIILDIRGVEAYQDAMLLFKIWKHKLNGIS